MTDKKLDAAWGVVAACIREGADPKVIAIAPERDQETRELAFQLGRGIYVVSVSRAVEFPHHIPHRIEAKP